MTSPGDPNDQNGAWGESSWGAHPQQEPSASPASDLPPVPGRAQLPGGSEQGPGDGRAAMATGRVEVSAATALLSAVPWFFWSFVVVSWVAGIIGFGWGWVLVAIWILSGAVTFFRTVEDLIARYLFRLRQPTLVESQRLMPVWHQLTDRVDADATRYTLWMQESEDVNATPTPGHTIAVTGWALYNLPPSHLEAALAHELSHHLGGRSWLSLLGFWYSIPARVALVGVRAIVGLMRSVPAVGCAVGGFLLVGYLGILLAVLTFGDSLVFPLLFLTPFIAPPFLAWVSRRDVKVADRRAAAMGYGRTLVQVLYGWQVQHQQTLGREANRRSQLMSATPSVAERVHALERAGNVSA